MLIMGNATTYTCSRRLYSQATSSHTAPRNCTDIDLFVRRDIAMLRNRVVSGVPFGILIRFLFLPCPNAGNRFRRAAQAERSRLNVTPVFGCGHFPRYCRLCMCCRNVPDEKSRRVIRDAGTLGLKSGMKYPHKSK